MDLARHANAMGKRLAVASAPRGQGPGCVRPADEVFAILPGAVDERLRRRVSVYYAAAGRALAGNGPKKNEVLVGFGPSLATNGLQRWMRSRGHAD